jgi:hypothetical protein
MVPADTHADAAGDAHPHGDFRTNGDSGAFSHAHPYAYGHVYANLHPIAYGDVCANRAAHRHADSNAVRHPAAR